MRIAVDIDGVLLDLIRDFCIIFNKQFNTSYRDIDVRNWNFFKDWNVSFDSIAPIFKVLHENPSQTKLIDMNARKVLKLLNRNYQVEFLTARERKTKNALMERLNSLKIFKGSHYEKIKIAPISPSDAKLQYDYDVFIDDNPNLANSIVGQEGKILLLYNQPWNQTIRNNKNVIRVKNWEEIWKYFQNLKNCNQT